MLRTFTLSVVVLLLGLCTGLTAQTRFIDPMFEVSAPTTDTFGQNIDVFLRGVNQLEVDVYEPADDTTTQLRPVVVMFPTGNFLIQYLNQGPYGSRRDSGLVAIMSELVTRGYVGMAAEYRTGWLPTAQDQDVRTSTLLKAAYRGGQDAHTLARFLRKTVAEEGNPYQIDTSRIVFWGLGTGGYVTMTHAFLDDVEEILADDRFYDVNDQPYVSQNMDSNPQGTLPAAMPDGSGGQVPTNIPNHVGYNSNVAMSVNAGGALGDLDWMEGKEGEPLVVGFHSASDPFAPFSIGDVIVPTTGDLVVDGVAGTEQIIEKANMLGLNDAIAAANTTDLPDMYSDLSVAVNARNEVYKSIVVDPDPDNVTGDEEYELSHDNMYPFVYPGETFSSPYNWMDPAKVRAEITAFNSVTGQNINADFVIAGENMFNPNATDAAAARTVVDTMIAYFVPRAYIGLDLANLSTSTEEVISNATVGLDLFPNPTTAGFTVRVAENLRIRQIDIFDINGRRVAQITGLGQSSYTIGRGDLPNGQYIVQLRLDEGTTARKVMLR
ncbi:T9SS type A sorting domain-containing protein [Neolewinella litorea]|uniref:T9SS type A sorting domain-containing protein n=1 Tax=Neolewinella litorea TaxID=2562452 RepID=A0A4S4NIN9_9BACT|nr:T9SS type A sorting domain-containing protein [Neolewinella litorea]THH39634.1 T9SS type A sorting domain-containing protein [Neolewinella litorea]